jgi:preprotein translocase subunit SecA
MYLNKINMEQQKVIGANIPGVNYLSQLTDEEIAALAAQYKVVGTPTEPYLIKSYDMDYYFKYSHLTKKEREANIVPVRTAPKIGRNEKCPCGSGKKFKVCCINP